MKSRFNIFKIHFSTGELSHGVTRCLNPSRAAFVYLAGPHAVTKNRDKERTLPAQLHVVSQTGVAEFQSDTGKICFGTNNKFY